MKMKILLLCALVATVAAQTNPAQQAQSEPIDYTPDGVPIHAEPYVKTTDNQQVLSRQPRSHDTKFDQIWIHGQHQQPQQNSRLRSLPSRPRPQPQPDTGDTTWVTRSLVYTDGEPWNGQAVQPAPVPAQTPPPIQTLGVGPGQVLARVVQTNIDNDDNDDDLYPVNMNTRARSHGSRRHMTKSIRRQSTDSLRDWSLFTDEELTSNGLNSHYRYDAADGDDTGVFELQHQDISAIIESARNYLINQVYGGQRGEMTFKYGYRKFDTNQGMMYALDFHDSQGDVHRVEGLRAITELVPEPVPARWEVVQPSDNDKSKRFVLPSGRHVDLSDWAAFDNQDITETSDSEDKGHEFVRHDIQEIIDAGEKFLKTKLSISGRMTFKHGWRKMDRTKGMMYALDFNDPSGVLHRVEGTRLLKRPPVVPAKWQVTSPTGSWSQTSPSARRPPPATRQLKSASRHRPSSWQLVHPYTNEQRRGAVQSIQRNNLRSLQTPTRQNQMGLIYQRRCMPNGVCVSA